VVFIDIIGRENFGFLKKISKFSAMVKFFFEFLKLGYLWWG
jgi:hypothetical protein